MTHDLPGSPHAEPWADDLPDYTPLNAAVTDVIIKAVNDLRESTRAGKSVPTEALVAVGPAGVGKTHLFVRLRRKLGALAVLVHVRPLLSGEMSPRFLLRQMLQQLSYPACDADHLPQIDLIAAGALARAARQNPRFPAACLQELRERSELERQARIEETVTQAVESHRDLDADYLERLLSVPFASPMARSALLSWLGGQELSEAQAARIGAREGLADDRIMPALRTIAVVSARHSPLLVVFDQLENLVDPDGTGGRVTAYGNLIAELVDTVRELVLLQMGLSTEWDAHLEPKLSQSQRSRVVGRRLTLALPTPKESEALLRLWSELLPQRKPFPWPFTTPQLRRVCDVGTTPRMLRKELRDALSGDGAPTPGPADANEDALAIVWEERLTTARAHVDEMARNSLGADPAYLADGLASLAALIGLGRAKAHGSDLLELPRATGLRWIALVHQGHHKTLGAALRKVAEAKGGVLALRERWRGWPPTWKATRAQWDELRRRPGVRWHWIDREDVVRLLALAALLKDARSADVSGPDGKPLPYETVAAWARTALEPAEWPVASAALGHGVEEAPTPPVETAPPPAKDAAPTPQPQALEATRLLRRLRVASVERLTRELAQASPGTTRRDVLAQLEADGQVRLIGRAIACWVGGA